MFKVMFELTVDGLSVTKTHNTKPTIYEDVKVWATQGIHYPAANALIRELEYGEIQESKFDYLQTIQVIVIDMTWI